MRSFDKVVCPICHLPLARVDGSLTCANRHSFDVARQGYVNLNSGKGSDGGDNAEMVAARREFLNKGYYAPLADTLAELVREYCSSASVVLDVGCGVGYYAKRIVEGNEVELYGVDLSKSAVKAAAVDCRGATFLVANMTTLPFADSSIDVAISVFAPYSTTEIQRVCKSGGVFITVEPAAWHLFELKQLVYGERAYPNVINPPASFREIATRTVTYTAEFAPRQDILRLLQMTPYWYRTSETDKAHIDNVNSLKTTVSFFIRIYSI